ncbi:hypothetical protein LCGC14_1355990 [marine sediment metagenome]|uniref:Uncharacterized protein n=1 Tax=marine sediment metagenome TaxID=412755 RepID=A0A0F9KA85_9ZZZZ
MKVKKVKCPMCHGNPNMTNDSNLDCGLCNAKLVVSQKLRMEYVRCFKKDYISWRYDEF